MVAGAATRPAASRIIAENAAKGDSSRHTRRAEPDSRAAQLAPWDARAESLRRRLAEIEREATDSEMSIVLADAERALRAREYDRAIELYWSLDVSVRTGRGDSYQSQLTWK